MLTVKMTFPKSGLIAPASGPTSPVRHPLTYTPLFPCANASPPAPKDIRLEADGGVEDDNIPRVADAGADRLVAGSAIFGKPDYKAGVDAMHVALS